MLFNANSPVRRPLVPCPPQRLGTEGRAREEQAGPQTRGLTVTSCPREALRCMGVGGVFKMVLLLVHSGREVRAASGLSALCP